MKAIILARVSDKKQDSNEAQVNRVSDYIKRAGLTIWKTYEIEESSTKGDRRKYQEAVADVEKSNETIAIVVDTVDRLQRSFKESVQLDELRKAGKLEIHFYREGLVLRKDSNSSELLRWDMAVMFARSYVLQLSDNVKRKQEQMRRNGEWTGRPPRGYVSVHDSLGKRIDIIADPNTAHLIQKMFELYATGNYSIKAIRDLMFKDGLRGSTGKALAMSMIDHILHNTFYYGEMCSKGKLYPHKYEPLISKELFDRCKRVRDSWNKKPFQYAAKPYIFRGLVRITKDDYDRKLKELKEKQYDINIQIEDHTRADESYYVTASTVFNLAKNALNLFESSEVPEKRALLNYLLQNYTVNGKTPAFSLRSPFDTILSVSTQPTGL